MIVHVPHASADIPHDVREQFTRGDYELNAELLRSTDWFTDELFSIPDCTTVRYPISRLVVDPERFESDEDEPMARVGRGVIYSHGTEGGLLRRPLSLGERQSLLERFYRPHHRALETATATLLGEKQSVTIVDAHSFPAVPWPVELCQDEERPDFCLGSDQFHTPAELIEIASEFLSASGFSVLVNRPYAGALVPLVYYRKDARVRALMIEVNRKIYLNESTGERAPRFGSIQRTIHDLCERLRTWSSAKRVSKV